MIFSQLKVLGTGMPQVGAVIYLIHVNTFEPTILDYRCNFSTFKSMPSVIVDVTHDSTFVLEIVLLHLLA